MGTAAKLSRSYPPSRGTGGVGCRLSSEQASPLLIALAFWTPWAEETTPVEIGNQYMEARNAFDAE